MTDKEKIQKLKPFNSTSYEAIDLDRLVIYTAVKLQKLGVELSLENIIVGAFKLFPKKFSLLGYVEFPDATRVEKCLWRCKGKKRQWIGGKTPHGYLINDRTRIISDQAEAQLLKTTFREKQKPLSHTRRKELLMAELERSSAYSKYMRGECDSISEADLCYLLHGTLDSSRDLLGENLVSFKKLAEEFERADILTFFGLLEERFKDFLKS